MRVLLFDSFVFIPIIFFSLIFFIFFVVCFIFIVKNAKQSIKNNTFEDNVAKNIKNQFSNENLENVNNLCEYCGSVLENDNECKNCGAKRQK